MAADTDALKRRRNYVACCLGNLVATLVIWSVYLLAFRSYVLAIEPAWLSRVLAETVRFLAFVGPSIIAVWWNRYDSFRAYRSMFCQCAAGLGWGVTVGGLLILANAAASIVMGRSWETSWMLVRDALAVACGPGVLFEELTYRGYFFRNLVAEVSPKVGYFASAGAFVAIHLPGYLLVQHLALADIAYRVSSIFALALLLGFVLNRSGSLIGPLLVHAANNFASVAFWR